MSLFRYNPSDPNVAGQLEYPKIQDSRREADYTVYVISVTVGNVTWTVERRYSEFSRFDKERFKNLKQSFLPSKRPLARKDKNFVEKRRAELEQYLRTIFELEVLLQNKRSSSKLPYNLACFLDFHKYEIQSICDDLAKDLVSNNDKYINSGKFYQCDPVQLFAITERLKLAEPTCSADGPDFDFGHILDFCQRLNNLKILGSKSRYGASNILSNNLEFDLSVFKKIKSLWICDCNASMINDLRSCRPTVNNLTVHRSFNAISDINLEKEIIYDDESLSLTSNPSLLWLNLKSVDFSFNNISSIDRSVIFFRPVVTLNFTGNKLTNIDYLQHLTHLSELNLSHNLIEKMVDWHQKLGNLKRLSLAANKLKSIEGLQKLYSLEYLDLRNNQLVQTIDVRPIGNLPCLKVLLLTGNPLEASVEYRSRILEWFTDRAAEVALDDRVTSPRELDTVGVRVAIRKAKEDREKQLRLAKERIDHALNMIVDPPYYTDSSISFEKDATP